MRRNVFTVIILFTLLAMLLAACAPATPTQDPNLQFTAVAATVQGQLTQIALLTPSATPTLEATATPTEIPATDTPSGPTLTPTKTPYSAVSDSGSTTSTTGDNSHFIADVTIPDGTEVDAGSSFTKIWRFHNTGTTTWSKNYYSLEFYDGSLTGANKAYAAKLPNDVKPGDYVEISLEFTAPSTPGKYISYWRLFSDSRKYFGDACTISIVVN